MLGGRDECRDAVDLEVIVPLPQIDPGYTKPRDAPHGDVELPIDGSCDAAVVPEGVEHGLRQ